jgi:signal transduction histidine kinase
MKRVQRLLEANHRLVFLAVTFGILPVVLRGVPQGTAIWVVILAVLHTIAGTYGWMQCQKRAKPWIFFEYFLAQSAILLAIACLEMRHTQEVTSGGPMSILLLSQSAQLTTRSRAVFLILFYLGFIVSALAFVTPVGIIPSAIGFATLMLVMVYFTGLLDREENARMRVDEANRKLTEYAQQAEELAVAKERNRLAREIHDNLGHYLTAVNMQIEAAMAIMNTDKDRTILALEHAQLLTKEGLAEVRRAVAALRAAPAEARPLHEALLTLVKEHQVSGLTVTYQIEGAIRPCSAQTELALYRIAQEGLTNTRKHAGATRADLTLDYRNLDTVGLRLQDYGVGTLSGRPASNGFGLLGIRERVELLGGIVNIKSGLGQGFILEVELPD